MPVLEITQLRLKGLFANNPQLLHNLSDVRDRLQTNSRFYTCIEDPAKLYIFGIWQDLEQHLDFLASPARDEVLGPQEDMLDFEWTVHIVVESMSCLPLDAPILALERLAVKEDGIVAFQEAAKRHVQQLQGSNSFNIVHSWRCDIAATSPEAVFLTGWDRSQAHVSFAARQQAHGDSEGAAITEQYKELLTHHARNLERKDM
jgi:heme-degrading monooxygenase HmoA